MPDPGMERSVVGLEEAAESRFYGKYRGIVKDNKDDKGIGRIKALVPEVLGETVISNWALPCAPYAGKGEGYFMVPPPEAGVWIEFEAGDVSRPIWSGCWWGKDEVPRDVGGAATKPPVKIIRSEKGLMAAFNDDNQEIVVSDKDGKNMLEIKVTEGKITIKGAIKAIVEAPQIELVENATHPVVFGDLLLQYLNQLVALFNTHMHPGETFFGIPITPAPPAPYFTPALPTLHSQRVKSG